MNFEFIVHQRSAKSIFPQVEYTINDWQVSLLRRQCFDLHCHPLSAAQVSCNACDPAQRTTGFWRIGVGAGLPSQRLLLLIKYSIEDYKARDSFRARGLVSCECLSFSRPIICCPLPSA